MEKIDITLYSVGLKLVDQVANTFYYKYRILDKQELASHLTEKLVLIISKFDTSRGIEFKYFAMPSLKGYAYNYVRDHGRIVRIPRKYSELYMKYNSLNKNNGHKLPIKEAALMMGIEEELLSTALTAAGSKFPEISSFNSTLVCNNGLSMGEAFLKSIPHNIYEMLEEIYLDKTSEDRVFLKRGLTPKRGRELVSPYLKEIHKLRE